MKNLFLLNLHQFDEGSGEAAEGAVSSAADLKADNAIADVDVNVAEDNKGDSENSLAKSETKKSFDELIKGEYKDDYNKAVEKVVKNRLKNAKDLQAKLDSYTPLREALSSRYGVDSEADIQAFIDAVYDDDSMYEMEALEKNIPVEDLKRIKMLERQNNEYKRMIEQKTQEKEAIEFTQKLFAEAEEVKKIYPDFNLDYEVYDSPTRDSFIAFTKAGFPMQNVYEVLHHDEVFTQAMANVANTAAQKVAESVKANKSRPVEASNSGFTGKTAKLNPRDLTARQINDLIRRSENGEKIRF